jgi:hypothetical protein
MGSKEEHLRQAQHNEDFFNQFDIDGTCFLDWFVTAIFYAALHYIRSLASKYGFKNISSYGDLDKLFDRLSILKRNSNIYGCYRHLKDDSRAARYDMALFSPDDVRDLRDNEYNEIKVFVLANL